MLFKKTTKYKFILMVIIFTFMVTSKISAMEPTIEEIASQMLMVGFRGTSVDENSPIIKHIKAGIIGNVILFDVDQTLNATSERNIKSPEQLESLIKTLKQSVPSNSPILWVAIDQEGGKVQRLRPERGFRETYPTAQYLGTKSPSETFKVAYKLGSELATLGIDVNFAPVADININEKSPAIGGKERSYSKSADLVTQHIFAYANGLIKSGLIPCLKHFPGHGSADTDTHDGAANVTQTWLGLELLPYCRAIISGWEGMIMSAHVYHEAFDPELPASLSKNIMDGLLRGILNWKGVIVTDDLHMGALTQKYNIEETIYFAINAGADILIFSSNAKDMQFDPDFPVVAHKTIVKLVNEGKISEQRLRESWERIMLLKNKAHKNQQTLLFRP